MSSFSRGLVPHTLVFFAKAPPTQCSRQAASTPSFLLRTRITQHLHQPSRSFQISARFRLAAARPAAAPKPTARAPAPSSSPAGGSKPAASPLRSYAEQLAARGAPTVLYEAPSHFWLRLSAYGAGFFCTFYAIGNYWSIFLHPPVGLPWWVPHAFAVICVTMGAMGGWFLLSALNIVRVVRAVPVAALPGAKTPAGAARWAKSLAGAPVALEVTLSRLLPLLPARKLLVAPAEVSLPFRMQATPLAAAQAPAQGQAGRLLSGRELLQARKAEEEARKAARKYDMDHLLTAPFRHLGQGLGGMWRGMRRALTREGFSKIMVKNKEYKIDVTSGWVLDHGRALDRLVTLKPKRV
ncbi:hypothetical protein NKR23_g2396 [Pleurostoma richardsiae]|uniref:Uncharacterized protein n=1 Tax=Pleurostoma richardsiae TaxID=41990 RepID=A0AA38VVF0_9PEZI|nr:hypothetical protein NKR23_g2396 [Pleurostoma richardsiae]